MDTEGSVTNWLSQLRGGILSTAQQKLWDRYFRRLVGLARVRLRDASRRAVDEEDIALSALDSFFTGMEQGRFPELVDRTSLWRLLASITARKAINQRHFERRGKRGGGRVRGDSAIGEMYLNGGEAAGWESIAADEVAPDHLVAISDECRRLMRALPRNDLRRIAQLKLEGYTNREIAGATGVVERTIERKLKLIRQHWAVAVSS